MHLSWLSSHQVRREQTPLQPPHTTVLNTSAALKSLAHVAPVLPDRNSRKNTNCHEYVTITCCPPIRDSELKGNCFKAIFANVLKQIPYTCTAHIPREKQHRWEGEAANSRAG